jgi:Copper transport outer membrane protein, MctB
MINFRFHLVSLIAVFLALGLGILVGSSVVDRVIVDNLESEIRNVRHDSSVVNNNNKRLGDQATRDEDALTKLAPFTVADRLAGVPVALVAEKGVDAQIAKDAMTTLRAAGATVPGILWLDERWRLDTAADLAALEKAAKVSGNNATARNDALRLVAARLAEPPVGGRGRATDVLPALRDAGFLDFTDGNKTALAEFPARAARALVITGTNSRLLGSGTMLSFVQSLIATSVPTVLGEAYDDHGLVPPVPQRGAAVAPVRGDTTLAKDVTTLDDVELTQGKVAAVIALDEVAEGTVGHYGYGQGASGGAVPPVPK